MPLGIDGLFTYILHVNFDARSVKLMSNSVQTNSNHTQDSKLEYVLLTMTINIEIRRFQIVDERIKKWKISRKFPWMPEIPFLNVYLSAYKFSTQTISDLCIPMRSVLLPNRFSTTIQPITSVLNAYSYRVWRDQFMFFEQFSSCDRTHSESNGILMISTMNLSLSFVASDRGDSQKLCIHVNKFDFQEF